MRVVIAALAILHWDFWWWDDTRVVFGFLPVGLAYHGLYSIAAGAVWALFMRVAWPDHLEAWASAREPRGEP
ncbi:MAG: DUF3311 domain-containing protein [Deltaproteobacteria bacterium]|nr:DUF3311 domain-containing protein [Deltaproteobacteria bacterium]